MKKPYVKTSTLVLAAACLFFFSSSALVSAAQFYSMGTGSPAGTYYFLGAGFAHLVNKYVRDVRITAESTAASAEYTSDSGDSGLTQRVRTRTSMSIYPLRVMPYSISRFTMTAVQLRERVSV